MDKHEWGYRRGYGWGCGWWPFALLAVLFLFFWGGHRIFWFGWPLLLILPFLVIFGVIMLFSARWDGPRGWFNDDYDGGPDSGPDENWNERFSDAPWEKPKRGDVPPKPKRDADSDIYYV